MEKVKLKKSINKKLEKLKHNSKKDYSNDSKKYHNFCPKIFNTITPYSIMMKKNVKQHNKNKLKTKVDT